MVGGVSSFFFFFGYFIWGQNICTVALACFTTGMIMNGAVGLLQGLEGHESSDHVLLCDGT